MYIISTVCKTAIAAMRPSCYMNELYVCTIKWRVRKYRLASRKLLLVMDDSIEMLTKLNDSIGMSFATARAVMIDIGRY